MEVNIGCKQGVDDLYDLERRGNLTTTLWDYGIIRAPTNTLSPNSSRAILKKVLPSLLSGSIRLITILQMSDLTEEELAAFEEMETVVRSLRSGDKKLELGREKVFTGSPSYLFQRTCFMFQYVDKGF